MNFNQLINEFRKLNPGVEIRIGDPRFDSLAYNRIFCSKPMTQLRLPQGYYANEKNGITNKHNSASGMYVAIEVEDLSKANPALLMSTGYNLEEEKRQQYEIDMKRKEQSNLRSLEYRTELNQYYKDQLKKRVMDILQQYPALPITMPREVREEHRLSIEMMNLLEIGIKSAISGPEMTKDGFVVDSSTIKRYDRCSEALSEIQKQNGIHIEKHPHHKEDKAQQEIQPTQATIGLQTLNTDPQEELARMARENRKFTILQRERAMSDAQKAKNRSAIMAGICILGAAVAVYFNGQDINTVLQHELNAIYSWETLGQYLQTLGPMTTLLAAGAGGFIAKYFKNSRKFKQALNEFIDFNASLENAQTLGGNENAKSR